MEIKLSLELERGQDGAGLHDLPAYEPDNLLPLDVQAVSSLLLLRALSRSFSDGHLIISLGEIPGQVLRVTCRCMQLSRF